MFGRAFDGVAPRLLAALLMCSGCDTPEDVRPETARSRQALSTPRRAFAAQGAPSNSVLQLSALYPLDGGLVFFAPEPFFVDGSGSPARSLGDLIPGPYSLATLSAVNGSVVDGELYFAQQPPNAAHRTAWKTNGTVAGTQVALTGAPPIERVVGASPLGPLFEARVPGQPLGTARLAGDTLSEVFVAATNARGFLVFDGGALFIASTNDTHLFFSDGTDAGTQNLTSGRADISRVNTPALVSYAGRAWFSAVDSRNGLWSSDGTRAGTVAAPVIVRNVSQVSAGLGRLLVVGELGGTGKVLVATDGSDAGVSVLHGPPNQQSTGTQVLGVTPSTVFFSVNRGQALWSTDGTDAGTLQVAGTVGEAVMSGNRLFFASTAGAPWVSDGTMGGTFQLSTSATAAQLFHALPNGRVAFFAETVADGLEPWVSDGTTAGTRQLASFAPGSIDGVSLSNVSPVSDGQRVWFDCRGQVCVTDGTDAGTGAATRSPTGYRPEGIQWLAAIGNNLVSFSGATTTFVEPDGGRSSVVTRGGVVPPMLGPDGAGWFIAAPSQGVERALWRTQGTAQTTVVVLDAGLPMTASLFAVTSNAVFLRATVPVSNDTLFAHRPDASLEQLPDFTPNSPTVAFGRPVVLGADLFFTTNLDDGGFSRLVRSDGTSAGTSLVDPTVSVIDPVAANGALWFTHSTLQLGMGLGRYDPQAGMVTRLSPGLVNPTFRVAGSTLYVVNQETQATRLYRTDGTDAGTELLASFPAGRITEWAPWGEGAVFVFLSGAANTLTSSVGVTDGTPSGTRLLPSLVTEASLGGTAVLANVLATDAGFFFGSWAIATGLEPAVLGRGETAPQLLGDVLPGPESAWPRWPVQLGEALYFVANDDVGDAIFVSDLNGMPTGGGAAGGGGPTGGGTAGGAPVGGGSGSTGGGASSTGGGSDGTGGGSAVGGGGGTAPPGCGCGVEGTLGSLFWLVLLGTRRSRSADQKWRSGRP